MRLPFALEPPVLPDAPEARRWLLEELGRPVYRAAEPTLFDRAVVALRDWFLGLFGGGGLGGEVIALIVAVVLAALVVTAFLVFGRPRVAARRARAVAALFGRDDRRTAAELRRAADAAAAAGDWVLAVKERFRAIVRSLDERELAAVHPGTTAHGFADDAARRFPGLGTELDAAATAFDGVRWLDAPAGRDDDARLRDLDRMLAASPRTPAAGARGEARG